MMQKGFRPAIVVLALVLGLAAIFGTQYIVKTYRMEEPFKAKVLSIAGIDKVELSQDVKGTKISLTVNPKVDLQETYQQIGSLAGSSLKGDYTIEVKENTDVKMKGIYQDMHFAIYEGIASGKFTQMASQLKEIAAEHSLKNYDVQVDSDNVYLKLVLDGKVYCKVIPRKSEQVAYINTGGGEPQW